MKDEIKKYTEFYGGKDSIMNSLLNELEKGIFSDCDEEFQKCCYYYITTLQEEVKFIEDYKDAYETTMIANKMLEEKYTDYKSKIDEAIKYIEKCRDYHKTYHKEEKIFPDEITSLLMILQGDNNE